MTVNKITFGRSAIHLEMKYARLEYIRFAYSFWNTGLSSGKITITVWIGMKMDAIQMKKMQPFLDWMDVKS